MIDYKWIVPLIFFLASLFMSTGCEQSVPTVVVYETSESGHKLSPLKEAKFFKAPSEIK